MKYGFGHNVALAMLISYLLAHAAHDLNEGKPDRGDCMHVLHTCVPFHTYNVAQI